MSRDHNIFKKLGIPGPKPLPLLGNFYQQISQGIFKFQVDMYNQYADSKVYGLFDAGTPMLYVRDLDMIRDICVKNFNSFVDHRTFDFPEPLDRMLTVIKGDAWKNVRATVSPAFSTVKLRRMFQYIIHNARCLAQNLREKQESGEPVELKHMVSCFTMDVIASTGFGAQINSLQNEENDFMKLSNRVMDRMKRIIFLTFFLPFLTKPLNKLGFGFLAKDEIDFFTSFVEEAMERRKEETEDGHSKRNDFLQLLMEADAESEDIPNDNMTQFEALELNKRSQRKPLTKSEIQAQAIIFLMAGFNTVSTVLSFTFFLLAQNPECCSRDLPYMDQVLNEAMRLYPPAFVIDRVCVEDTVVEKIHIPKGMNMVFPMYAIHHDPAIWVDPETFDPDRFSPEQKSDRHPYAHMPFGQYAIHHDPAIWVDPETFDPDRFSPEQKSDRHPYAHMPFGQGPRSCVGMRLALLEMKVALATILQEMTPVICSKTVLPLRLKFFQTEAEDGLWVKFTARKKS
ncbi:cytochrome p450 3a11 [Plakobranchus ocellatus]|uniref:Cytochrome p450 3a11 n=1 Tax=Plakobranchus ocellatus TaxID=259542 RepID=A0AAV4AYE4_9GAST|nr:cytochrome p450 3a11 [Plakobranchus ocellatus]